MTQPHDGSREPANHDGTELGEATAAGDALARRIWRRHAAAPGVIQMRRMLRRARRVVRFGADRLPLLANLQRRWNFSGSGAFFPVLTHHLPLIAQPFAESPVVAAAATAMPRRVGGDPAPPLVQRNDTWTPSGPAEGAHAVDQPPVAAPLRRSAKEPSQQQAGPVISATPERQTVRASRQRMPLSQSSAASQPTIGATTETGRSTGAGSEAGGLPSQQDSSTPTRQPVSRAASKTALAATIIRRHQHLPLAGGWQPLVIRRQPMFSAPAESGRSSARAATMKQSVRDDARRIGGRSRVPILQNFAYGGVSRAPLPIGVTGRQVVQTVRPAGSDDDKAVSQHLPDANERIRRTIPPVASSVAFRDVPPNLSRSMLMKHLVPKPSVSFSLWPSSGPSREQGHAAAGIGGSRHSMRQPMPLPTPRPSVAVVAPDLQRNPLSAAAGSAAAHSLQRQTERADSAGGMPDRFSNAGQSSQLPTATASSPESNVDMPAIADQVYELLLRRLQHEQDRRA